MTATDIREFNLYLFHCTDRQVFGVLEKERAAERYDYVELAKQELKRRGLEE